MARLDLTARTRIGDALRAQLPNHWRVTPGDEGQAFLEVDQDGQRRPHEHPAVGSTIIRIDSTSGIIHAVRYTRVKHPPGYAEGRQFHSDVVDASGRGWLDQLVDAIVASASDADTLLSSKVTAEA